MQVHQAADLIQTVEERMTDLHVVEYVVPFLLGLFLGGGAMTLVAFALAAGSHAGARDAAFYAGMQYERHRSGRALVVVNDLDGDEATELGRIG